MSTEIRTGTDAIRQALAVLNKKVNLAGLARDLSLSAAALEAFIYGRASLAPETLKALAVHLFDGRDEYDMAIDKLRPAKREEPRPLGIRPPPITESMTLPVYQAGPAPPSPGMVTPAMPIRRARAAPSRCACRFR